MSESTDRLNQLSNNLGVARPIEKPQIAQGGIWMPEQEQNRRITELEKRVAELEKKL